MLARTCALALLLTVAPLVNAEQMRGVVTSVDVAKKELVIEGRGLGKRGKSFTFTFGKDVRILFGDEAGAIADLAGGQTIRITYEAKDGAQVATTIQVNGARRPAQPTGAGETIAGVLRRVAYTEREIIVAASDKGKEAYTTLPVAEDAKIARDGKGIAFDDLKEEERCSVKVEVRDSKKIAVSITIGAAESPKAGKPDEPSKIAKVRMILKIADAILEMVDRKEKDK